MSEKRRRGRDEYLKDYKKKKKEKEYMIKIGKKERYYMGKEDINALLR